MKKGTMLVLLLLLISLPAGSVQAGIKVKPGQGTSGEVLLAGEAAGKADYDVEAIFPDWNEEAPAIWSLIEYVEAVTDEASPEYIPPSDRVAVFDLEGTLAGELFPTSLEYYMLAWRILKDPSFTPDEELLLLGREIRDSVITGYFAEDFPIRFSLGAAKAYAGMTQDEFADFVTEILIREADGFKGMNYGEAFYQPMINVVEYLQDNDFKVYVCSGSDRQLCRILVEGMLDIPYENIIGADTAMEATGQKGEDGADYQLAAEDELVRSEKLPDRNTKMNKVDRIVREIGRQPVLAFGNSSSDCSMLNYSLFNNSRRSAAFMLIANDEERDYGNAVKADELGAKWEAQGYTVISMRDDFRTLYGEGVVKTGSFRWAEELAEEELEEEMEDPEEDPEEELEEEQTEELEEELTEDPEEELVEESEEELTEDSEELTEEPEEELPEEKGEGLSGESGEDQTEAQEKVSVEEQENRKKS